MSSREWTLRADYLETPASKLFYLLLEPREVEPDYAVLFLHPFAEEMNLSRHVVAAQARSLAAAGCAVMLPDLTGCGDSSGGFEDASWQGWQRDAAAAADFLCSCSPAPLRLWGLRAGALLASELAQERAGVDRLLLWQPVLNGEQQIDQFLRLKSVAEGLSSGAGFDRAGLWSELRGGASLDVAGYRLAPELALQLAAVRLKNLSPGCPVSWLEMGRGTAQQTAAASDGVIDHWREQGLEVAFRRIIATPFWRTVDAPVEAHVLQATAGLLSA